MTASGQLPLVSGGESCGHLTRADTGHMVTAESGHWPLYAGHGDIVDVYDNLDTSR